MGHFRLTQAVGRLMTALVLVAITATTFVPMGWESTPAEAANASDPATITTGDAAVYPAPVSGDSAPAPLAELNTLLFSEAGQATTLAAAVEAAGGQVYVRAGDALFVGLDAATIDDLAPAGARAMFDGVVNDTALAELSASDQTIAQLWNDVLTDAPVRAAATSGEPGLGTSLAIVPDQSASGTASKALAPAVNQTSVFMAGSVTVEVVFVESYNAVTLDPGAETWTEQEMTKVKAEVVNALQWWTVAATAPAAGDTAPRPSANLTWNVNYYSPRDLAQAPLVTIETDPIQSGVYEAAEPTGWMAQIAANFTADPNDGPSATSVRTWADEARNRTDAETDWAFVLFVVDSSEDADGRFDVDHKIGGSALNGPWAVVTYDGGDELGVSNLEVLIAKMVGHVFGAGNEAYDPLLDVGCRMEEVYGYLRIAHDNCDYNDTAELSLMLEGDDMVSAYAQHLLSDSARAQVGWLDSDADGLYDVIDTLTDDFPTFSSDPVCPTLHLTVPQIPNDAALPASFGSGNSSEWYARIWNPTANNGFGEMQDMLAYQPVNINYPSYVWGRANSGEWVAGDPLDGEWDSADEGYALRLPTVAGALNEVEIAIMNRWEEPGYMTEVPELVHVATPSVVGSFETSLTVGKVDYFQANGEVGGWTEASGGSYSSSSTMFTDQTGNEACFAFSGREATLVYTANELVPGTANVYVDGELHSVIDYGAKNQYKAKHLLANLPLGIHEVSIVHVTGVVDFDAISLTDSTQSALTVIDGLLDVDADGFYEETGSKLLPTGGWASVSLPSERPAGTTILANGTALENARPLDRMSFNFKNADTVAIYRRVYPGGGSAELYLDGELYGTMYNNAKTDMVVPYYISGFDSSSTLIRRVSFRVNEDAPYFDLEAVRLLRMEGSGAIYNALEPAGGEYVSEAFTIPYDGAQESSSWQPEYNTRMVTNADGALETVFFQASAISVLRNTGGQGLLEVYIDGKLVKTLDNSIQGARAAPAFVHGLDPSVPHVLQVRHVNANPARPRPNRVWGFELFKINPVPLGVYEEYTYDAAGLPVQTNFIFEHNWQTLVRTRLPTASESRWIRSRHNDSAVFLYFTGANAVTLYAASGGYGAADVYVNGELVGVFYQKGRGLWQVPFTVSGFDKNVTNVLELRVHDERGFKKMFNIDKVRTYNLPVLEPVSQTVSRFYEDNEEVALTEGGTGAAMAFSGLWTEQADVNASGGTYRLVNSLYDQVSFEVKNTASVVLYRRLWTRYRGADVYVDGVYHSSFDNFFASSLYPQGQWDKPHVIAGLDPGFQHTVTIKPQLFGRKMNQYKPFTIDRIEVRGNNVSSGTGMTYIEQGEYAYNHPEAAAPNGTAIQFVGDDWEFVNGYAETRNKGERALVVFYGNAFQVSFNKFVGGGQAYIYIDGELHGLYRLGTRNPVADVPFSVGNLEKKLHTAEIIVRAGRVQINSFRAYTMTATNTSLLGNSTFDFVTNGQANFYDKFIMNGEWEVADGTAYLQTREKDASLYFYVTGSEALFLLREMKLYSGAIDIYVNGELYTTAQHNYVSFWRNQSLFEEEFAVGSLDFMADESVWIELRNSSSKWISLASLRFATLNQQTLGPGVSIEAEAVMPNGQMAYGLRASGYWRQQPGRPNTAAFSNGYFLQSMNQDARLYIAVQSVDYVQVYRRTGAAGDIDVYLDGEYWGMIPGRSGRVINSAPFAIGPIPLPAERHVIELRQNHKRVKMAIDKIETMSSVVLQPGYYENNALVNGNPAFLYMGAWYEVSNTDASGDSFMVGAGRGQRIATVFQGDQLTIYRRASLGAANSIVYIDGNPYPMYNKSVQIVNQSAYTILLPDEGPHTLEIVNDGGRLEFDALEIGTAVPADFGAYQEDDPMVIVNGLDLAHWIPADLATDSEGSYIWTRRRNAGIFFMFEGQRITVYMNSGYRYSAASMYIDGQLVELVDLWERTTRADPDHAFFTWDYTGLEPGVHVLEIRPEGKKIKRRGAGWINLDAISVDGAPVPTPAGLVGPSQPNLGEAAPVITAPSQGCFEEQMAGWRFLPNDGFYNWATVYDAAASMDRAAQSPGYSAAPGVPEMAAEFKFSGSGFAFLYLAHATAANMQLYVDGNPIATVIASNGQQTYSSMRYEGSGYDPNTEHTLKVVNLGPAGARLYVDRIDLPVYNVIYNDNCVR